MAVKTPFVLLDDARDTGASDALLFRDPRAIFAARRPEDVEPVLQAADDARRAGGTLAGYVAYEAGLAMEPKLAGSAAARSGARGPLVWFGLFDCAERIVAGDVPAWLAENGGNARASIGPLLPQLSTNAYLQAFERLQQAICAGDIYQANLTMPLAGPAEGDPVALYAAIRSSANAGYGGLVFDGSHWLLSFSPELFFSLKDGRVKAKPMKGTRPRGRNEDEDEALAAELAASAKDKAENLMIVDLMRNDLSRVARPGTVRVDRPFDIESYPTVHTMVSTINAQLTDTVKAMDVLRALFPCGSITGAPKIRAMELINEVEPNARGPYCGAIGRIGPVSGDKADDGDDAAFNVAIRTVRLTPGENQRHQVVLGVGGAIVADSDGMAEWRECLVKGGFTRGIAGGHDLIETMRWEPEGGIPLLELHLQRLAASAAALGFAYDESGIRARLHAVCAHLSAPVKLRLLLARSGNIALETATLPPVSAEPVCCIALPLPVVPSDWRLRHKSTDRSFHEAALAAAHHYGATEAILVRADGLVTEGTYSNIFVEAEKELLTPPAALGLLPGVGRRALIEEGRAKEAELALEDLVNGFWLGNAVRGLRKAVLIA